MGNRICLRRAVEEQLTRPRRLERQPSGVDYRKLRKLILAGKLAPCFNALDEDGLGGGLEDCPICFLYFPSLNRSVCCGKGICTECFIQMRSSNAIRTIRCPFCKSSCYAVEYRGARTEEEKGLQQAEEQKVLEAKIRMQIESHNTEQVVPPEQTCTILETQSPLLDSSGTNDGRDIANPGASLMLENIMLDSSSILSTYSMRHKECDPGLEKIMLMEALWQSLQDFKLQKGRTHQNSGSSSMVGPESGTDREYNVGTYLSSFDQGELPLLDSLGDETVIATMEDWGIAQQMTSQEPCSESFCHIQTSVDIHRNFIEESNAASSEIELSADSSQIESSEYQVADISFCSVGNLVANPFAAGSSSSVSVPSPSNASCECLPHLGRYYSEIIGKMTLEQPFMLITHSNI